MRVLAGNLRKRFVELGSEVSSAFSRQHFVTDTAATDAKVFYRLETWQSDPDEASTTVYLRQIAAFQRSCAMSAYRIAGGTEERANAAMGSSTGATLPPGKVRSEGVSNIVLAQSTRLTGLGRIFLPNSSRRLKQRISMDCTHSWMVSFTLHSPNPIRFITRTSRHRTNVVWERMSTTDDRRRLTLAISYVLRMLRRFYSHPSDRILEFS